MSHPNTPLIVLPPSLHVVKKVNLEVFCRVQDAKAIKDLLETFTTSIGMPMVPTRLTITHPGQKSWWTVEAKEKLYGKP